MRKAFVGAAMLATGLMLLTGCGANSNQNSGELTKAMNITDKPETTTTPEVTPAEKTTPTPTAVVTQPLPTFAPIREQTVRGLKAKDIVAEMKVGWNLGNTFDATDGNGIASETSWGNPKTTADMIRTVAEAGFNVLRIPCTWGNHRIDANNTIDPAWLARVKEVVDYGMDNGMYVILNAHHENDWQKPDNAHIEETEKIQKDLWRQIAEYFADYGDHLIFEGMNEPRVVGSTDEWNGGTKEGRDCINRLNANFVDTVRATGGNNRQRILLITTYAAAVGNNAFDGFVFPKDEYVALSLHAYTPYRFTYSNSGENETAEFTSEIQAEINNVMNQMAEFSQKGNMPVVITECGCETKPFYGKTNAEEIRLWANGFFKAAQTRGFVCTLWDNGNYDGGGERFGILNRKKLTWYFESYNKAVRKVFYP